MDELLIEFKRILPGLNGEWGLYAKQRCENLLKKNFGELFLRCNSCARRYPHTPYDGFMSNINHLEP